MSLGNRTRRHFTDAAREAAALARQRKREHRLECPQDHQFVMLVVRIDDGPGAGFAWQIRRYGHIEPVAKSRVAFKDPGAADRSGRAVLQRLKDNGSVEGCPPPANASAFPGL